MEFVNNTNLEFKDISTEEYRVYQFADGSEVKITLPTHLNVSKSGGHRIFDEEGISHYIPSGWNHLYWKAKTSRANFVA